MHLLIVSFFLYSLLCSQDLLTEARKRLAEIARDPDNYSILLEGLVLQVKLVIFPSGQDGTFFISLLTYCVLSVKPVYCAQGFYQLLEAKVTVRCRQQDLDLVQVRLGVLWSVLISYSLNIQLIITKSRP